MLNLCPGGRAGSPGFSFTETGPFIFREKADKMKPEIKDSVITWVAVASFVVGVTLTFLGLFLPPTGVIDNSVLVAVGQFLTLAAAGLGVKEYVDGTITRMRMQTRDEKGGAE